MKNMFRDVPVAWLQLGHSRPKLLAAVVGIVFADLLIWMQLGFLASAIDISTYIHRKVRGDLVILNPQTESIEAAAVNSANFFIGDVPPLRGITIQPR